MSPGVAGVLGSGLGAAYLPVLRNQIRDGEVRMPVGGTIPLRVRRDDHPLAFRLCAAAMVAAAAIILGGVALLIEGVWR